MGMPDEAYKIRVNNRALLAELLAKSGIAPEHHAAVFLALDKRGKITDEEISALLKAEGLGEEPIRRTFALLSVQTLDQAALLVGTDSPALATLREFFALSETYGIADRLVFDIAVIRGLAYYTGIVFEAFDTERKFRAIFGGGRYNSLLTTIGGTPTPAVGLGFGDVVVVEVLKDLLGETAAAGKNGVVIGYMFAEQREAATRLARALRVQGETVDLMLSRQKPKQFFSRAGSSTFADAIFIGPDDVQKGAAKRKNLATREETDVPLCI